MAEEIHDLATPGDDTGVEVDLDKAADVLPEMSFLSDTIWDSLDGEVSALRRKLSVASTPASAPPFPNELSAAMNWIAGQEEECRRQLGLDESDQEAQEQLMQRIEADRAKLNKIAVGPQLNLELRHAAIAYAQLSDSCVRRFAVPKNHELARLSAFSSRVSKRTGFGEVRVLDYVLTGIRSNLPRISVRRECLASR